MPKCLCVSLGYLSKLNTVNNTYMPVCNVMSEVGQQRSAFKSWLLSVVIDTPRQTKFNWKNHKIFKFAMHVMEILFSASITCTPTFAIQPFFPTFPATTEAFIMSWDANVYFLLIPAYVLC